MADRYLLESSAVDGYLLEDGTGVLLLEADVTATETFTHANSPGSLSADYTWDQFGGTGAWGIVSNQASCSGALDPEYGRIGVDADITKVITAQATLVTFTRGAAGFVQSGVFLQKDATSTMTLYAWAARRDTADGYFMFKLVGNSFTQLGSSVVMTVTNGDVLKLTWHPLTNTLTGYVNGVSKLAVVDTSITANTRTGIYYAADNAGASVVVDTFSVASKLPTTYTLSAAAGAYTVSGASIQAQRTSFFNVPAGSYSVNGASARLNIGHVANVSAGTYAVSGADADLVVTTVGGAAVVPYIPVIRPRRR